MHLPMCHTGHLVSDPILAVAQLCALLPTFSQDPESTFNMNKQENWVLGPDDTPFYTCTVSCEDRLVWYQLTPPSGPRRMSVRPPLSCSFTVSRHVYIWSYAS